MRGRLAGVAKAICDFTLDVTINITFSSFRAATSGVALLPPVVTGGYSYRAPSELSAKE